MSQFGMGNVVVGEQVTELEAELGLDLVPVPSQTECSVRFDDVKGVATVDWMGAIQTFLIMNPQWRTVGHGIGVGSTYAEIVAAYPRWVGGIPGGPHVTQYGGRFVTVVPIPDNRATGRHMLFELDAQDVVRRYRVGAPPYVQHTGICRSPE
ncbi:MAG TPA: hypothetical protein VF661_11835 [Actinomycetales bacterium]